MSGVALRRGFSLSELLVVVSIVALLAALLLPSLALVRSRAKSVRCAGNLRQLSVAIAGYGAENEGLLVNFANDTGSVHWYDLLAPYVEAEKANGAINMNTRSVFLSCPAWNWGGVSHWTRIGYGMCHDNNVGTPRKFWNDWSWATTFPGQVRDGTISELTCPSSRILIGESAVLYLQAAGSPARWGQWAVNGYDQRLWDASTAPANPVRHSGRANYGFVDGHVGSHGPLTSPWGYVDPTKFSE